MGSAPRRLRTRRPRRRTLIAAGVTAAVLAPPVVSYVQALTYPGSAPFSIRTVEWVRDNGGAGLVDAAENYWYSHHVPSGLVPHTTASTGPRGSGRAPHALPDADPTAGGEGQWVPGRRATDGTPEIYTTYFQPDSSHEQVVAGAAWIRAGAVAHLVAGTTQPDKTPWPGGARVDPSDVPNLLATFNSGFKFADTPGGFLLDGRTSRPLVNGLATVVIDDTGHLDLGALGTDVTVGPHTVAARQNLQMVVEDGHPVAGLDENSDGAWGSPQNQHQFTWRSGLGVDTQGDVVYVAGDGLDLVHLADALVTAGAVRGMELDIHSGMASFSSWAVPSATTAGTTEPAPGTPVPTRLLPDMSRPADRYLTADQRDFFYLTVPTSS